MIDRKKVIKGLQKTAEHFRAVQNAQRENGRYVSASFKEYEKACVDALALLKEQEAVEPRSKSRHGAYPQFQHFCGNCNAMLHGKPKFCSNCGRKVKWK